MKLRSHLSLLLAVALAVLLAGCGGGGDTGNNPFPSGFAASGQAAQFRFDPSASDVPLPMDIMRNPQTGFNAVPGTGEPYASINSLQGWSTAGPLIMNFSNLLDPASINAGSILVIDTVAGVPVPYTFEHKVLTPNQSTVLAYPVRPLTPFRRYMVIATNKLSSGGVPITSSRVAGVLKFGGSLVDGSGNSTVGSLTDEQAAALEPLRAAWQAIWASAETVTGQPRADIPFAWTFTTQPLFQTLPVLRARVQAENIAPIVTASFVGAAQVDFFYNNVIGLGTVPHDAITAVYVGYIPSPQYLSDKLNGPFQGTPSNPTQVGTVNIPFLAFRGASTASGTMVYSHGITRTMLDSAILANSGCANGLGVIAINYVLHGNETFDNTFGLTYRGIPGQPSGTGFINLNNLRMARDNVRQSTADFFALSRMIAAGNTDFDGGGGADFSTANQVMVGMSLGSIISTNVLALEPNLRLGVLNVPGGRIARLLRESPTWSPQIIAGLEAAGIQQGTLAFEQFFWMTQTVVDDADSFNHAPAVLTGALKGNVTTRVMSQEMIGDAGVPNVATDDLTRALGIPLVLRTNPAENQVPSGVATVAGPANGSGLFQYINGQHGFLLDPTQGPTAAAHQQVFTYLLTGIASGYATPTIIIPAGQKSGAEWVFPYVEALETLFRF